MLRLIQSVALCIGLLGFFTQVNAKELYVFQDAQLKAKDGKSAKVYLGVPVKVKKDMGKESKVVIHGFLDGDNLYSTKSKELLIAKLDKGFKVIKKSASQVELVGSIDNELLTENAAEIWEEHEEFYFDMCSVCHAAPQVPHHTMIEWEALFTPMVGFAKLDKEEASYLLRYIKSNASNGLVKVEH